MEVQKKFMESLHAAFVGEDLSKIVGFFAFPVVIYSTAGVTVLRSECDLLRSAEEYRDALQSYVLSSTKITVLKKDTPMNQRFRVTVRYQSRAIDTGFLASTLVRYFVLEAAGSFKIEMVEYIEDPIPGRDAERIVH